MKSLYDILDVAADASDDEIKRAYKQMALKYHPDKSRTRNAEDRFKQIRRAYEVLADNKKREIYDHLGDDGLIIEEGRRGVDSDDMSRLEKSFSVSMEEISVSPKKQATSKKRVGPRNEKLSASQHDLPAAARKRRTEKRDGSSTTTAKRKLSKSRTRRKSCDEVDASSSKVIAKIKPQPASSEQAPSHAKNQSDVDAKNSSSGFVKVAVIVLLVLACLNLLKNIIHGLMLLVQVAINAAIIAILYFVLTGHVSDIWSNCQYFVANFWTISSDLLLKIVHSLMRR